MGRSSKEGPAVQDANSQTASQPSPRPTLFNPPPPRPILTSAASRRKLATQSLRLKPYLRPAKSAREVVPRPETADFQPSRFEEPAGVAAKSPIQVTLAFPLSQQQQSDVMEEDRQGEIVARPGGGKRGKPRATADCLYPRKLCFIQQQQQRFNHYYTSMREGMKRMNLSTSQRRPLVSGTSMASPKARVEQEAARPMTSTSLSVLNLALNPKIETPVEEQCSARGFPARKQPQLTRMFHNHKKKLALTANSQNGLFGSVGDSNIVCKSIGATYDSIRTPMSAAGTHKRSFGKLYQSYVANALDDKQIQTAPQKYGGEKGLPQRLVVNLCTIQYMKESSKQLGFSPAGSTSRKHATDTGNESPQAAVQNNAKVILVQRLAPSADRAPIKKAAGRGGNRMRIQGVALNKFVSASERRIIYPFVKG